MRGGIELGTQVCGDLNEGARREWLVTDGCGGYAMGTVAGLRTRRYHGLLVVAERFPDGTHSPEGQRTPARRTMALASLDPVLTLPSGTRIGLATHEWASGAVEPRGHIYLERFDLTDGLPRWRWRVGDVVLERELAMGHGRPELAVVHRLLAGEATLTVHALCTWRDAHGERYAHEGLRVEPTAEGFTVEDAYRVKGPGFAPDGAWWRGAYHREEAARGLNPAEDLWHAGTFTAELRHPRDTLDIHAWPADVAIAPTSAAHTIAAARGRAKAITESATDATDAQLALAADAFVTRRPDVVAGYPWFGAWSRDTMIAYEGLFLTAGRTDEGRALLTQYAATLSEGMLANTADTGRIEYNTSDATLWFLHAVERHVHHTGDVDLAADLAAPIDHIIERHLTGTRYGIRVDPADGLLMQGAAGHALTWMDAVVDGTPVTPRAGKAVDINALWVNGLGAAAALRERTGHDATELRARRDTATAAFRRRFPTPLGWLRDTVDPDDSTMRPNQLLAFSLPYSPMEPDARAVRAIGAALLTPLGMRSLSPNEPGYRGVHRGDPAQRDAAYHQGTVWPWLIGPYVDACLVAGLPADGVLDGLVAHLGEWGLGSVSETADGDPPHTATGCPFQGWSVAELRRARRTFR